MAKKQNIDPVMLLALNGWKVDTLYFISHFILNVGSWDIPTWNALCIFLQNLQKEMQQKATDLAPVISTPVSLPQNQGKSSLNNFESIAVFFGVVFYTFRRTVLYSATGIGKSLLSIAIGMANVFKRCLYILVDNAGEEDISRYQEALGEKAIIISFKTFNEKSESLNQERKNEAIFQVLLKYKAGKKAVKEMHYMDDMTDRVNKRMGVKSGKKPIDNYDVLDAIIEEGISDMQVDFICLDSLNALAGDSRSITRGKIRRITQKAAESHVTMLCLHHTNKAKVISGTSAISEEFDYVYRLSRDDEASEAEGNAEILVLAEEKARYSRRKTVRIRRTFNGKLTPDYELVDQGDYTSKAEYIGHEPNLSEKIIKIISAWKSPSISFTDLKANLEGNSSPKDGSIKNALKQLETEGVVQKTNSSWATIAIMRK